MGYRGNYDGILWLIVPGVLIYIIFTKQFIIMQEMLLDTPW